MINELYDLARSLEDAKIDTTKYHDKLQLIPKITVESPCVRIVVSDGVITSLEPVPKESAIFIRRFGDNQGFFPGMNLAPLFRLSEDNQKKELEKTLKTHSFEKSSGYYTDWCVTDNWNSKLTKKITIGLRDRANSLQSMLGNPSKYEDADILIAETRPFLDVSLLREELKNTCFRMLERGENPDLALRILFYPGKKDAAPDNDFGKLSVVFDSDKLSHSSVSKSFSEKLNQAILEKNTSVTIESGIMDAFSHEYSPTETSFPKVKLAAGFEVILRTMNSKPKPALIRYGHGGNDTYALSDESRKSIAAALSWIGGSAEKENILWARTGVKNEALFAYSSSFGAEPGEFVRCFKRSGAVYEEESKEFMERLRRWKENDPDTYPEWVQVFVLRKINNGCSKVMYSRQTDPDELMKCGERWKEAAENVPRLNLPRPYIPFPLEVPDFLNRVWTLEGKTSKTDNYHPVSSYHGVQLQFEQDHETVARYLHLMVQSVEKQAVYCGSKLNAAGHRALTDPDVNGLRESVVMMGMCLYWLNIRKEEYMNSYPFLLGQLLKVADSLHESYCYSVRDGQLPPQLVGSSFYISASEMPQKALSQIGQRMIPYIAWAKTHRDFKVEYTGSDNAKHYGPAAYYQLWAMEKITSELNEVFTEETRFNDQQKAELFLGYIAALPRSEKSEKE